MRSSVVPTGTSTELATWFWPLVNVPELPRTDVPGPPI